MEAREAPPESGGSAGTNGWCATVGFQVSSDVSTNYHVHRQSSSYEDVHPNIVSGKNGGKHRTHLNINRYGGSLNSDLSILRNVIRRCI